MNENATVLITGNTYPVKEALKSLGGRWDPASKGWKVPAGREAEARALVAGAAPKSPARPTGTRRLSWRPCGYPGCNPGHCDECDGKGAGGSRYSRRW